MEKEKFKTLVDKSGKYITIDFNIGDYLINKEYSMRHSNIPELYSTDTTLEQIDRNHHNTLMDDFKDIGCELKELQFI
jgi:hypothetical protein